MYLSTVIQYMVYIINIILFYCIPQETVMQKEFYFVNYWHYLTPSDVFIMPNNFCENNL